MRRRGGCRYAGMGSFEIIEHTADVGIRAHGATREELFEQATLGLAHIIGIATDRAGERLLLRVTNDDVGALLVDWVPPLSHLQAPQLAAEHRLLETHGQAMAKLAVEAYLRALPDRRARRSCGGNPGEGDHLSRP